MDSVINIEIDGQVKSLKHWAEHYEVPYISAYRRYKRGKVGADIFKVKSNTVRQYQAKSESFIEMGQLNLSIPQWQLDELERIARLNGMKRTKYAHKIIADYIQNKNQI
jgi:hypothetical protein